MVTYTITYHIHRIVFPTIYHLLPLHDTLGIPSPYITKGNSTLFISVNSLQDKKSESTGGIVPLPSRDLYF